MIKRVAFLFVVLLALASSVFSQGVRKDDQVTVSDFGNLRPVAGATVRVCSSGSTGNPCIPLASIFSDSALTQPLANPFTADAQGNYHFYAAAGTYDIQTAGTGVATVTLQNVPVPCIPGISGCGGGGIPCVAVLSSFQINSNGVFGCAQGVTTSDGNSVNIKGPIPWVDVTTFGVRALAAFNTITTTTNSNSATVTTTGVSDFQVNDGIVIPSAGNATVQSTPVAPTVTPIGATGSTSISYRCVGVDTSWGLTAAGAAGTSAVTPQVFGWAAVGISSISRSGNVVTVTAASPFKISSGTFHAVIANVTGGSTQFSGLQLVTVTGSTTLTYNQTGANESGTVTGNSYVLFKNAFVITTAQATAGSNQLVLTTDVNHNIQFISSGTRPVRIYLDGINFATAGLPAAYADGTFAVAAVTSNTITVTTAFVSPTTTTGTANIVQATSGVAQMTATVYPVVDVACPALTGTTQYYAVYGNYGSGYAPVGFTPWGTNILEDYGPAWTQSGLILPPAMNLPATPSGSAQNQVYTGQITKIVNTTLTVTPNVPTAVASITAQHDNGIAFNTALRASCASGGNSEFNPVYIPALTSVNGYYLFSAPIDLTSSGCNRANIVDGGPLWLDGTVYASNLGTVEWSRPMDIAGWTNINTGGNSGGQTTIIGKAPTMMVSGPSGMKVNGISFSTLSNTQTGLMVQIAENVEISNSSFSTLGANNLSSIPLYYYNAQFGTQLHNITWGCSDNTMYPIVQGGPNSQLGDVTYWTVPCIEIAGSFQPKLKMDGINYGVYRGIQFDNLYTNLHTLPSADISDVDTFQAPQQGLLTVYGSDVLEHITFRRNIGDSVQNPPIACITSDGSGCAVTYYGENSTGTGLTGILSGAPFRSAYEVPSNGGFQAQNTNEFYQSSTGIQIFGALSGTSPDLQISCKGGTGNSFNVLDTTEISRTGITCPGGLLNVGGATNFLAILTHSNTANRAYGFSDMSGNLPVYITAPVSGNCAYWSGTTGLLADFGAPCSGGGGGSGVVSGQTAGFFPLATAPTVIGGSASCDQGVTTTSVITCTLPFVATSFNKLNLVNNSTGFQILGGTTSKTFKVNNSLTLAGTDGDTLTVNNSLTLAGTDSTTMTFPAVSSTIPAKICSQVTIAMSTAAVGSAAKSASPSTGTCTGLTSSDTVSCSGASEIFAVVGFQPSTSGILSISTWPTSNTINAEYENNTTGSITPGALTLNCAAFR